jgi:hypothetical protein
MKSIMCCLEVSYMFRKAIILFVASMGSLVMSYPISAKGMDWDTAVDVASCSRRPGYENVASQVTSFLHDHGIKAVIMYYIHQDGLVLPTYAPKAEGFLVLVNATNKVVARKLLTKEIENGLHITLLTKSILEPK